MEKKFEGTPAPWVIENGFNENGDGKYFPSVVMGNISWMKDGELPRLVVNESHDQNAKSIMANAYLIAAAPDLLEACILALRDLQPTDYTYQVIEQAIHKSLNIK